MLLSEAVSSCICWCLWHTIAVLDQKCMVWALVHVHKLSPLLGVKVEFRGYSSKVAALSQSAWLRNAETQGLLEATWLHHTSPIDFRKGVESAWWRLRTYTCSWDSSKNPALKGALTGRWKVAIYDTHSDHNHQKWTKLNQHGKTSDEIVTLQYTVY